MSIANTQWENYDNIDAFKTILNALRPWGYTDESWGNDACPKICLLGDAMNEQNITIFVGFQDTAFNDAEVGSMMYYVSHNDDFAYDLGIPHVYYGGNSITQVIAVAKAISAAQETYSELLGNGYKIISTGGGCTAWAKELGEAMVTVNCDSSAVLTEEYASMPRSSELVSIGVYDSEGSPVWGDGTDLDGSEGYSFVRIGDRRGLAESLAIAEEVCRLEGIKKIDLINDLSTVYQSLLFKHFTKYGYSWSADDLLAAYGAQLNPRELRVIRTFIKFFDAIQDIEKGAK